MLLNHLNWLAYFYWDPPSIAFTVPFIDRPVFWYGILFVAGFIIGYFILIPIFIRFINQSRYLSSIDIKNWPGFIEVLRHSPSPLVADLIDHFDSSTRQLLPQSPVTATAPLHQQGIIEGINRFLKQSPTPREKLQEIFGSALATPKETACFLIDRLCWFLVAGAVIGARLGQVFFYDWPYFSKNPLEIFKIWHGGLASHGGVLGIMIALYLYRRYIQQWEPQLTFLRLLDYLALPSALAACFIRLGNFMNQEILGTITTLPWGVVFGHPYDGSQPAPRHPVQLYESGAYLAAFFILWHFWNRQKIEDRPGFLIGLLFILIFGSRFILEYWKAAQPSVIDAPFLEMGQLLSIPFVLLGIFFIWKSKCRFCYQ